MGADHGEMAALFPRWTNSAFRWALVIIVLVVLAIPLGLMAWVRTPWVLAQYQPIEQPIPFDHRHHVVDDNIDCRYCHTTAENGASAGYPSTELCMGCHNQIWNDSPLLEPVRESYYADVPIRWERVHRLPDFVYFNHAVHVNNGIGCESCHGRVDRMARIYQVEPLTMGWCLDCHREPLPHLRPPDAITTMGYDARRQPLALIEELTELYDPQPGTDCTSCHR